MNEFFLYLLESSISLTFLYLIYLLLLKNVTFFNLNRFVLLGILLISMLFPLISIDFLPVRETIVNQSIEGLSEIRMSYYDALENWSAQGFSNDVSPNSNFDSQKFNWSRMISMLVMLIYGIGIVAILSRLLWTYTWIYRMKRAHPSEIINGVKVIKLPYPIAPFSFWNSVFACKKTLNDEEFPQILAHEKIHIEQRHSLDLIIVQLLATLLWFNPTVWWLTKSLKTTHEYIADRKMISLGYSLVEYQSLLLSQLISNHSNGLVHNFNLSFIKKRIAMMKIKKSGWVGKAKTTIALVTFAVFGLVMIQCNSRSLEGPQESSLTLTSQPDALGSHQSKNYLLPTLPATGYKYDVDPANSVVIEIYNGRIHVDGEQTSIDEIADAIKNTGLSKSGIVVMKVDKEESMKLVTDVQWELRLANRRKLLYVGQSTANESIEMAFLLPPVPGSSEGAQLPTIDDEYARANDLDILKINLGESANAAYQKQVYDFVMEHVAIGKANYVVSAKSDDGDTYNEYLVNLTYIQEGFNQIYNERSMKLFGKNFYDLDIKDPAEKQQYNEVRKGIPRAISVAERQG
ncbi:MAG: M56 family metallopeptidase [Bacteroidota bacterium]